LRARNVQLDLELREHRHARMVLTQRVTELAEENRQLHAHIEGLQSRMQAQELGCGAD